MLTRISNIMNITFCLIASSDIHNNPTRTLVNCELFTLFKAYFFLYVLLGSIAFSYFVKVSTVMLRKTTEGCIHL